MAKTILEAIRQILDSSKEPMMASEIYKGIVAQDLYHFNADDPAHVVRTQIRRHCKGLDFASASPVRHFDVLPDGRYALLPKPVRMTTEARTEDKVERLKAVSELRPTLPSLKRLHRAYEENIRRRVLLRLSQLEFSAFERFSRKLLEAYGFESMKVTRLSRDGGIDGHGQLKVGLAKLNVAFQCKKWSGAVGRPEIDRFRGAIQGSYEQGIFFTTSRFTAEAQDFSFKAGAVPIVLIDGPAIVDLMIEKRLGIETQQLQVYSYALDMLIADEL